MSTTVPTTYPGTRAPDVGASCTELPFSWSPAWRTSSRRALGTTSGPRPPLARLKTDWASGGPSGLRSSRMPAPESPPVPPTWDRLSCTNPLIGPELAAS